MSQLSNRREFLGEAAVGLVLAGAATCPSRLPADEPEKKSKDVGRVPRKKGIADVWHDKDWKRVKALGAGWIYNWSPGPVEKLPEGVEFVPMIWNGDKVKTKAVVARVKEHAKENGYRHLLGFNEPDERGQANMSVDVALETWPLLAEAGLRLGSPAAAQPTGDWMKRFMQQADARKYRVDFVAIHWYGGPNAKWFLGWVEEVYKLYRRPIWITEFAIADWGAGKNRPNHFSRDQVLGFLRDVLPELERASHVERYAWFSAPADDPHIGPSALFEKDGSPTAAGKYYAVV